MTKPISFIFLIIALAYSAQSHAQTLSINFQDTQPNNISLNIYDIEASEKYLLSMYYMIANQGVLHKQVLISIDDTNEDYAFISQHQVLRMIWAARLLDIEDIPAPLHNQIIKNSFEAAPDKKQGYYFVLRRQNGELIDVKSVRNKIDITSSRIKLDGIKVNNYWPSFNLAPKEGWPIVVILGGSEGGYAAQSFAIRLALERYFVSSVAYFGIEGTPDCLSRIEINKLKAVIDKLQNYNHTDGSPVILIGISRGADYAIHFAKHYPDLVKSVVLVGPDTYLYRSTGKKCLIKDLDNSPLTVDGVDIPFIPHNTSFMKNLLKKFMRIRDRGIDQVKQKNMELFLFLSEQQAQDAVLPLRTLKMPVLVLKGQQDRLSKFDEEILDIRATESIVVKIIDKAGHGIIGSIFDPVIGTEFYTKYGHRYFSGGNDNTNADARYTVWLEILAFLKPQQPIK